MTRSVHSVLEDRTDLPVWITHLTKNSDSKTAFENLTSIIGSLEITAKSVHGAYSLAASVPNLTKHLSVCFMEIPLHNLRFVVDLQRGRDLQPYGISIARAKARQTNIQPVWYIDQTPGHTWLTTPPNPPNTAAGPLWTLINAAVTTPAITGALSHLLSFFDINKPPATNGNPAPPYEFWWEREWRHIGNYRIQDMQSSRVLIWCPEDQHDELRNFIKKEHSEWKSQSLPILDLKWHSEKMLGVLAGCLHTELRMIG